MIRYVIDASAATEYFLRTPLGLKLADLIAEAFILPPRSADMCNCGGTQPRIAAGATSGAYAVRRRLHTLDNDEASPLSVPQWYADVGKKRLRLKAVHGDKAKNDTIDSHKIAALLRGGMLSQASGYPAAMRATRALLRRRMHLLHKRAELLSHVHNTNSQYNVPEIGKNIASKATREGVTERFPRVQDFASYCRLVTCAKESGGKRLGTSGQKIGNAHLRWAFAEAATLFLCNNEPGQKLLAHLEKKHAKSNALSMLAQKLGRAVYDLLKRKTAFDRDIFLRR